MSRKQICGLLAVLAVLCLLCACRSKEEAPQSEDGVFLYFVDSQSGTGSILKREVYNGSKIPTVRELVTALLAGPGGELLHSPFPVNTSLRSWSLKDGVLTLDMSEHYGGLSGIDLTLADYCLTLTLCQIERVQQVRILVAGEELSYRAHGILDPSEVVLDGLLAPLETDGEKNGGAS